MKPLFSLLVAALALPLPAAPIFRNPLPIAISTQSVSDLLTADFNNDGHADIMVVSPALEVAVYLDNGTGPFAAPVETPLPWATIRPLLADVNRDGSIDLVVTDWSTRTVAVMFGAGNGTFTQGPTFNSGDVIDSMALADFNGDTFPDLATAINNRNNATGTIAVWFGDGAGHFSGAVTTNQDTVGRLTAADLDRDGKNDLIAGNRIYTGNGNGTFVLKTYMIISGEPQVADFNHDGKPDFATAAGGTHDWFVEVFLGNGDATFAPSTRYSVGYEGDSMAVADLDGDSNLDLLVASTNGSSVSVLRGNANGTFQTAQHFLSGPSAWRLAVADFDRDGKLDFVTVDYNSELWAMSFVRGNGDGTFQTYRAFHTVSTVPVSWPGYSTHDGVVADMNHDGKNDVVVLVQHPGAYTFDLAVMLNDGTGILAPPILTNSSLTEGSWWPRFAIGDLNHDGNPDAAVVDDHYTHTAAVLLGNGSGGFGAPATFTVPAFGSPVIGNFNGDGHPDLFISGTVYPGNGDGTFGVAISSGAGSETLLFGDLNGDGTLDFVSSGIRWIQAHLNDGVGHFTESLITEEEVIDATALADFNEDGKLDLLMNTYWGTEVRFGNGDGTFGAPLYFTIKPVPNYPWAGPTTTADVDGDGHLDVAFGTSLFLGNGDGTFRSKSRFRTFTEAIAFGDLDGNGTPDLVSTNQSGDDVDVLLTRTTADPTELVSIAMSLDRTTAAYPGAFAVTATVTGGLVPFGGVVRFAVDGHPLALIAPDDAGKATFQVRAIAGPHTITTTYTGDENYAEATASTNVTVTKGVLTPISIGGSPNPGPALWPVRISFFVPSPPILDNLPGPTGTLTIHEGDTAIATPPAKTGFVNYTWSTVGAHPVTVDYAGDANYEAATGGYTQQITKPVPQVALQLTPSTNIIRNTPVTLRLQFSNAPGLTGSVSFYRDSVLLQTVPVSQGAAEVQTTFEWGQHSVTALYSGDATWASTQAYQSFDVYGGTWDTAPILRASAGLLYWSKIVGATAYTIYKKTSIASQWQFVDTVSGPTFPYSMPSSTSWLFAVSARDASNNYGPLSAPDLATSVFFTDSLSGVTKIRATHLLELRTAIGAVRTLAGLAPYSYTDPINAGDPIRTIDVAQLRVAINEARNAIGLPLVNLTDPVLTPGQTPMRAAHVTELRAATD